MKISLEDYSYSVVDTEIGGEFPVCEDHEVSLPWKHTYFVGSGPSENSGLLVQNWLHKYDRISKQVESAFLGDEVYINEPCLMRT